MLICLFRGGWGVQNWGKPAFIIVARSLKDSPGQLDILYGQGAKSYSIPYFYYIFMVVVEPMVDV